MGFNKGVLKRTPLVGQEMRSYLNIDPSIASQASLAFNAAQAEGLQDLEAGTLYFRDSNFDRVATTFSRTGAASRVNAEGVIQEMSDAVPRIDYRGGDGKWMWEPSCTNLFSYSEDWNRWGKSGGTQAGAYLHPSPMEGVDAISMDFASTGSEYFNRTVTVQNGKTYTLSCFFRKSDVWIGNAILTVSGTFVTLDLTTGNIVNTTEGDGFVGVGVHEYNDDWYRLWITHTAQWDGNAQSQLRLFGGNKQSGEYGFLWNAQFEEGSSPSSAIRTTGSIVTRNADAHTITTLQSGNYLGSTAGTWYNSFNEVQEGDVWVLSNGTEATKLILEGGDWKLEDNAGTKTTIGSYYKGDKIAVRWSGSDIGAVLNGGSEVSTTVAYGQGYTTYSKGTIGLIETKQEIAFPTQLTVAECQTLTS